MKKIYPVLLFYAGIPFLASAVGFVPMLTGVSPWLSPALVPGTAAILYILFRKGLDLRLAAQVNGAAFFVLLICFTVLMLIASGSISGTVVSLFLWLIFPFLPQIFILSLMSEFEALYLTVFLTYAVGFILCAALGREKLRYKKLIVPAALIAVCLGVNTVLYFNRPEARYSGHGFAYMHGYSSTDLSDYTVYSDSGKLAVLDRAPSFTIENAEDMPVLDGAEACYPLYAAFAKAVYRDIDVIENEWPEKDSSVFNGRIVTFTNTVAGFERLIMGGNDAGKYGNCVDMFFGARPSPDQLQLAKDMGVEVEITPIGREAFVFFAEEDNPVSTLTSAQIKAIYHGDITDWRDVGGKKQEITAFQRPRGSGSQTVMEYFMGDVSLKEPKTYETVNSMTGVIQHVAQYANEEGALGYSFRYFLEGLHQEKGVKLLAVDGVYPDIGSIEDGSYPLTAEVCLVTRKNDDNPFVQKMKTFILSPEGQSLVRQTGYGGLAEVG